MFLAKILYLCVFVHDVASYTQPGGRKTYGKARDENWYHGVHKDNINARREKSYHGFGEHFDYGKTKTVYGPHKDYDYIIVGAGTSGSVLATRLSNSRHSVLLIEAGETELGNDNVTIPAFAGNIQLSDDDWNFYSIPQARTGNAMNERRGYWPRGKVVGGCSSSSYFSHQRGAPYDYDTWDAEGAIGWSYKDVLPYFLKSEDMQVPELQNSVYHAVGGPYTIVDGKSTPISDIFRQASADLNYPVIDCNADEHVGFCPITSPIMNGERCSSASCFLRPSSNPDNLDIWTKTLATRIILKGRRAIGVEVLRNGSKMKVYAKKEVIISGGIINSPQILMLSGIGPADQLNSLGIPVVADLPVGYNLQDQNTMYMHYSITPNITINTDVFTNADNLQEWKDFRTGPFTRAGADGTLFAKTAPSDKYPDFYPDIWIFGISYASDPGIIQNGLKFNLLPEVIQNQIANADYSGINLLPLLVRPESKGFVKLQSTDPLVAPLIIPNHFESDEDVKTVIRGIRLIQELIETPSFQAVNPTFVRRDFGSICEQEVFDTDAYWECMLRYFSLHTYHTCCTNRMGSKHDPTAVVDPQLRVKGVKNLRVVDASVMRDQIAGDPLAPAIMIGEKAADMILGINTVQQWRDQIDGWIY